MFKADIQDIGTCVEHHIGSAGETLMLCMVYDW
jgi:hypothetical protein